MTIYFDKARQRWRYDFERRGLRHSGYCEDAAGRPATSKRAAKEAEGVAKRLRDMTSKVARAGEVTIAQIAADLTASWKNGANWNNQCVYLREIIEFFGAATAVASISDALIEDYIAWALRRPVLTWIGGATRKRDCEDAARFWKPSGRTRNAATVNRYLPVLRAIFDRAHNIRDPLTRERAIEEVPKFDDLREPKRKPRPVPDGVLSHVLESLPTHVREAVIATLLFGFRRTEIFRLEIADLDFENGGVWLSHKKVKDKEDAFLPGSPEAMVFMRELADRAIARGTARLITWQVRRPTPALQAGEPWRTVESPKRAWATAMKTVERAFGRRWRWHDIRAAYISRIANTAGQLAAQTLARHSDYRTTQAYVLVDDNVVRAAASRASERPALAMLNVVNGGKSPTQNSHTPIPLTRKAAAK